MTAPPVIERPSLLRLRDPLSEVTRRERRALLGVALLGLVVAKTGLLPAEIVALGVKFASSDQRTLLLLLAFVTGYFFSAFLVYASSDFVAWRISLQEAIRQRMLLARDRDEYEVHVEREVDEQLADHYPFLSKSQRLVLPVSVSRAMFEFAVPLIFSAYAIIVLLTTNVP